MMPSFDAEPIILVIDADTFILSRAETLAKRARVEPRL